MVETVLPLCDLEQMLYRVTRVLLATLVNGHTSEPAKISEWMADQYHHSQHSIKWVLLQKLALFCLARVSAILLPKSIAVAVEKVMQRLRELLKADIAVC